jgi:hypothetical protein
MKTASYNSIQANKVASTEIQRLTISADIIGTRLKAHQHLSDKIDCYLRDVNKLISIYESRVGIRREIDPGIFMKMGAKKNKKTATSTATKESHQAKIIPLYQ